MRFLLATAVCLVPGLAMAAAGENLLHSFGGPNDGAFPAGGALIVDSSGVVYGAAPSGGTNGSGVVFSATPPAPGSKKWTYTILHEFAAGEGDGPLGSLMLDSSGAVIGVTNLGGTNDQGTVFRLAPPAKPGAAWALQTLWNFSGGADGAQPYDGLIADAKGVLYGTTYGGGLTGNQGGSYGNGVVYTLTPPVLPGGAWTQAVLYRFVGTSSSAMDGSAPIAALSFGTDGSLYGTTQAGGLLGINAGCSFPYGCGTVFHLTQSSGTWQESLLHEFGSMPEDAALPEGKLAIGPDGSLYGGTAAGGGDSGGFLNRGTVFQLTPPTGGSGPWTYNVLKNMAQAPDFLELPIGNVVLDKSGALYGAASDGGPAGPSGLPTAGGGIFKLTPPGSAGGKWTYGVLHHFTADNGDFCKSGCYPYAGVVLDAKGRVAGTTLEGGSFRQPPSKVGGGVIFELK